MAEGIIRCGQCRKVMGTFSHDRVTQPSVVAALIDSGIFRCRGCAQELSESELAALSADVIAIKADDAEAFRIQSDVIGGANHGGE